MVSATSRRMGDRRRPWKPTDFVLSTRGRTMPGCGVAEHSHAAGEAVNDSPGDADQRTQQLDGSALPATDRTNLADTDPNAHPAEDSTPHQAPIAIEERPTFGALIQVGEFRALIIAFLLHYSSGIVATLAISLMIYDRTNSALLSAIALASPFIPHIVGATFLLSLADRLAPRRSLALVGLVQVLVLGIVALDVLPVGVVLVVILLGGLAQPIGTATRSAALPEILDGASYVLGRAVLNVTSYTAQALGYAVGGIFVTTVGTRGTLSIATAASVVGVGFVWYGIGNRPARAAATGSAMGQTWKTNGLLLRTRAIRGLVLAHWLPLTLAAGAQALFVPFAAAHGSSSLASLFFWAMATGALTGDLIVARFASSSRQAALSFPLALLVSVPLIVFVTQPSVAVAVVLCFLCASGASYCLGLQRRFVEAVPSSARAQAFGLIYSGIPALQGITIPMAGALAAVWSPGTVIAIFGLASGISSCLLLPHFRGNLRA